MHDDKSINLNTRDIRADDVDSRIVKTILRRVPASGSKFAVLELSTKAVKLLIGNDVDAIKANVNDKNARFDFSNFLRVSDKVEAGKGLDARNEMDMRYFSTRVLPSILRMKKIMLENDVDTVYTVATAAYRTAKNREEILNFILDRARINVRILTKEEESLATLFAYTFTSSCREQLLKSPYVVVIDQGGGSTEISVFKKVKDLVGSFSTNLGTTALHNFFFRDSDRDTPIEQALRNSDRKTAERLKTFIKHMDEKMLVDDDMFCVGVGSAITHASGNGGTAKQHDKVLTSEFVAERIARADAAILGRVKTVGELDAALRTLGSHDRFDSELTIRLGLPMLLSLMERYHMPEVHISGTGLWYGIYFQRLWNILDE